jgi:hypothetical protein
VPVGTQADDYVFEEFSALLLILSWFFSLHASFDMYSRTVRADGAVHAPAAITTPLIVVSIVFPILSAIAISLKHWAQRHTKHPLHAEDGWLWLSWVCPCPAPFPCLFMSG